MLPDVKNFSYKTSLILQFLRVDRLVLCLTKGVEKEGNSIQHFNLVSHIQCKAFPCGAGVIKAV